MRIIKRIFLILYIAFLGFVVFFNTTVFGVDSQDLALAPYQVTSSFDNYFTNMQDEFDYNMFYQPRSAFVSIKDIITNRLNDPNYNYYIEKVENTGHGSAPNGSGYKIYLYSSIESGNTISTNQNFEYANFSDYNSYPNLPSELQGQPFYYPIVKIKYKYCYSIYNWGQSIATDVDGTLTDLYIPFVCYNYTHPVYHNNYIESSTSGATAQITNSINQQTNTIKDSTNQTVKATQQQTNELLDTNNTGNDTMSVNDTTTDTSADLTGLYNSINSAFTDNSVQTIKEFTFTLPNGDNHTIQLRASTLLTFLNSYPVLKAFYQSIFWVIFGGYVIFDFKKIINKMKEGNIDNVVGSSNPVDSVVNMSLK